MRRIVWFATIVCLAFVMNAFSGAALAAPKPRVVVISNVHVDPNSLSGTQADITWSASPNGACDVVQYAVSGSSSWTTVTPACGSHAVALSGLRIFVTYAFKITSSAKRYTPSTFTGSFYPVDASLSKAYEGYQDRFQAYGSCGWKSVYFDRVAEMPGDLEFDPGMVGNPLNYERFDLHIRYYGQGEAWCWPYQLTTKRTVVNVYVQDLTSGIDNWIVPNVEPVPNIVSEGYVGSVSWSISVDGGLIPGNPFGVSLQYVPSNGVSLRYTYDNTRQPDGSKHVAWLEVNWNGAMSTTMDVVWPMHIIDQLAQYRLYDKVQIRIVYTFVFDLYNPSFPIGPGPWLNNDFTYSYVTTLGQGWDNNRLNNLDQYTNLQVGTSDGP